MRKRKTFNNKRKVQANPNGKVLKELLSRVSYSSNPEHKRNPGDFALTPPSQPRADKTLCDTVRIIAKASAESLLKAGVAKGLVSEQMRGDFPQNVWAVTDDGYPLEAQLENMTLGTYHGYPMPTTDPFRNDVLENWKKK